MLSVITLVYDPKLKTTMATFGRRKKPTRHHIDLTPASIARLNETIIKLKAKLEPSIIGNIGWFATFNESEVKT